MDTKLRFTVASGEFASLMGPATANLLGRPWPEIAAALALDPAGQIALALARSETWSGVSVAWPAGDDGTYVAVELSGLPVFDRDRALVGFRGFGICRNRLVVAVPAPTRQTLIESASSESSPVLIEGSENVVPLRPGSASSAPALSAGEHNAFQELRRQLTERLIGAGRDLVPPSPPSAGARASTSIKLRAIEPDPERRPPAAEPPQALPRSDPDGAAAMLARAHADVRDLASILATAAEARRQDERSAAAKSELLARISHEIRNPLNAILGLSEAMTLETLGPVGNERYRDYLAGIHASGQQLLSLVSDLADLSRIKAGQIELDLAEVALDQITQQCVALMQPHANRARVIIRSSLAAALPPVSADAGCVRQIALNLIASSIKLAGASGRVFVSTARTDRGEVALRVRDNGPGMTEEHLALALEPLRPAATTARPEGPGLGLPLAKALAEANRAVFSIKSDAGAGTLVEVVFRSRPTPEG